MVVEASEKGRISNLLIGLTIEFFACKPRAWHAVASATFEALTRFCLFGLLG
jgi:hypothetical protein